MSVPVWKRKLSSAQFLYEVYKLNIRLGEILINKPQKYKPNYADDIIKTALSCLEHLQIADSIYLSKYSSVKDYEIRRENFLIARGQVEHLATACYIFLEIVKQHDHASEGKDSKKISDQELEIGEACEKAYKLISGVLTSDKELFKTYIEPAGL